jgi:putative ABC transport system permease protein
MHTNHLHLRLVAVFIYYFRLFIYFAVSDLFVACYIASDSFSNIMQTSIQQYIKIVFEGAAQAAQQLAANKLRTFLSLLGVTIGIFCIIGVKSAMDSLEANIRGSLKKLGDDTIYIEKFSWGEDPGQNYWKWMKRPNATFAEYEKLSERLDGAQKVGFWLFLGMKTLKWESSYAQNAFMIGCTEDCNALFNLEFQGEGRFFSSVEYQTASQVCVIGNKLSKNIFGENIDPLGREVNIGGRKLRVVGVLAPAGKDLLKPFNFDNGILIGMNLGRRSFNVREDAGMWSRASMMVKAKPNVTLEAMKDELTGVLRSVRRVKPREENNFALNTLSILSGLFDTVFATINVVGFVIGGFALIVGAFSVANIMFVSVKERTGMIGIKMALGAKRSFILLEILIEAMVLCLTGGLLGIFFIWLLTIVITKVLDFEIFLSASNILTGIVTSIVVGLISGIIPAWRASKLDPVEAMRK